ncbi:MAG: hypothetical protein V4553_19025 [Bacteroidota bacterium]
MMRIIDTPDDNYLKQTISWRSSIKKVMNQTHIHLLITHLPIIGAVLGAFVLIHGYGGKAMLRRSLLTIF